MENPEQEISQVVRSLTQSPPSVQRETIDKYFTRNATLVHPFCRTGKFRNSRLLIHGLYRCYKIMSPRVDISINSVAFDKQNLILYVHVSQIFRIWFIPFHYAPVSLVTVLQLEKHSPYEDAVADSSSVRTASTNGQSSSSAVAGSKYYIASQNDLYQTTDFPRFVFPPAFLLVWIWQLFAMVFCNVAALVLTPLTWAEERLWREGWLTGGTEAKETASTKIEKKYL
ncbi:hypothetical protein HDK77DRAFT_484304 [Phyllosticta capitalensis]|uniref:SigF-like NTF2-like domain-containing protein n=1 Tax=Phyllosticta capitalensis TaxID=121624 RepID=A0ABR1YF61_9PEZI